MPTKLKNLLSSVHVILAITALLGSSLIAVAAFSTRISIKVDDSAKRIELLERFNTAAHKQLDESILRIEIYFQYMSNKLDRIKL